MFKQIKYFGREGVGAWLNFFSFSVIGLGRATGFTEFRYESVFSLKFYRLSRISVKFPHLTRILILW